MHASGCASLLLYFLLYELTLNTATGVPSWLICSVIVGTRIESRHCASITYMIRHYAEPEGRVIFDHRHNAYVSAPAAGVGMAVGKLLHR